MTKKNFLNFVFVFFQFAGILYLLFTGPIFPPEIYLFVIELLAIAFVIWAVISMKLNNINVLPDLKREAKLVKSGPYRLVRHPMYLATIIVFTVLLLSKFSYLRLVAYLVLWIDLLFKLNYEEKLLKLAFQEYSEYQKKTYRLIPFIY